METPRKRKLQTLTKEENYHYNTPQPTKRFKATSCHDNNDRISLQRSQSVPPNKSHHQNININTCNTKPISLMKQYSPSLDTTKMKYKDTIKKQRDTQRRKKKYKFPWLLDGKCEIKNHRVVRDYYQFLVQKVICDNIKNDKDKTTKNKKHDRVLRVRSKWLYHGDIQHLKCFQSYLKLHNLSNEDAENKTYIVEEIWGHKHCKKTNEILFEVKWLNWSSNDNTWEPHSNLFGNIEYINYCNSNHINYCHTQNDVDQHLKKQKQHKQSNQEQNKSSVDTDTEHDDDEEEEEEEKDESDSNSSSEEYDETDDDDDYDEYILMKCKKCKKYKIVEKGNENKMKCNKKHMESFEFIRNKLNAKQMIGLKEKVKNMMINCKENNKDKLLNDRLLMELFSYDINLKLKQEFNDINAKIDDLNKIRGNLISLPISDQQETMQNIKNCILQIEKKLKQCQNSVKNAKQTILAKMPVDSGSDDEEDDEDEDDDIDDLYLKRKNRSNRKNIDDRLSCIICKRKWCLENIDLYDDTNKICNNCPSECSMAHLVQESDVDLFICSCCIHDAHIAFELLSVIDDEYYSKSISHKNKNDRFNTNGISLSALNETNISPFLIIKSSDKEQWKLYEIIQVIDDQSGEIKVIEKHNIDDNYNNNNDDKGEMKIILNEISKENILWALHSSSYYKTIIHRVIKYENEDHIVIKPRKHSAITEYSVVKLTDIIHLKPWYNFESRRGKNKYRRKRSYCSNVQKSNVDVVETAIFNSRYFASANDENKSNNLQMEENIIVRTWSCPLCTFENEETAIQCEICNKELLDNCIWNIRDKTKNITNDLLKLFGIIDLDQFMKNKTNIICEPKRKLSLNDISQYRIVLIIGESGSGKTSLLKQLHEDNKDIIHFADKSSLSWNKNKSIISELGNDTKSTTKAMKIMSSIGMSSIPTWLKPYFILSQGEQYRATFARLLNMALNNKHYEYIMIDEVIPLHFPLFLRLYIQNI